MINMDKIRELFQKATESKYLMEDVPRIVLEYLGEKDLIKALMMKQADVVIEIMARVDLDKVEKDLEEMLMAAAENEIHTARLKQSKELGVLRVVAKQSVEMSIRSSMQLVVDKAKEAFK